MPLRVVVLISGTGTLLQALLDAQSQGRLDAQVVAVGSDRPGIAGLQRAAAAGVPSFVHPLAKGADRAAWDRELAELVGAYRPDLVVSAGFMKLLGAAFLDRFSDRIINTHPALLPAFPGMHAVAEALAQGVPTTGATVFRVDAGVDSGEILAQESVPVLAGDDVESLHERIKIVERRLLVDTVNQLSRGRS